MNWRTTQTDGPDSRRVGNDAQLAAQPLHRRRRRRPLLPTPSTPLHCLCHCLPAFSLRRDPTLRRVVIYSSFFSNNFHVCQSIVILGSPPFHLWLSERRKWRRKEQVRFLTRVQAITDLNPPSVVIKVGMVGDSQIGKTSLMVKYVEGSFDEDYIQTLGKHSGFCTPFPPILISPYHQASISWKRQYLSEERPSLFQYGIWAVRENSSICYRSYAMTQWQSSSCLISPESQLSIR